MKAPDKIYLQVCGECPEEDCKNCKFEDLEDNVTWCKDRIYKKDIEYICKDALIEWLESKVYEHNDEDRFDDGFNAALGRVIDKLNSM